MVLCPLCVWALLIFSELFFYCNLQNIRIERELIKHTFLFHFLHCVNVICVNITKKDGNNLSLNAFSPWACASMTNVFPVWKMP